MNNQYRMHRWRSLHRWAIISALCIVAYAGCADSADTVKPGHTTLAIDNLRVDSIAGDVITVAFTINEPAAIFWTLYAHNAPAPDGVNTVISNARSSSSDPMIAQNGAQEDKNDAGAHTITLIDLPSEQSYNLYVAAVGADGAKDLADALPITTVRNISDVEIRRAHSGAIGINWTNPSAHTSHILEKIVIDWNAINHDGERTTSGSYRATHTLTADARTSAILPLIPGGLEYHFSLTALYRDGSNLPPVTVDYRYIIDDDGDGLIDIYTLEALSNIRCSPEGTVYHTVGPDGTCFDFGVRCGVDGATDCTGYELRADLDFNEGASYITGVVNPKWRPNTASNNSGGLTTANRGKNRGWIPIENIATTFEGNGHTIENLYVRDTTAGENARSGLFAQITTERAHIKNLTLKDATIYGGDEDRERIGALAGELSGGTIENVAVIGGTVEGGDGNADHVGGIVGQNINRGAIRNSYTTGNINGGNGGFDLVGGIVGRNNAHGVITDSRATGTIDGGDGNADQVGELVGINIDSDGDGLIDIDTLEALSNIRCNPNGAAYGAVELNDFVCFDFSIRCGIDGTTDCSGYELRRDLNFNEGASYAAGAVNPNWRPNATSSNSGWRPIGSITTTFEGNGHTIENLYIRNTTTGNNQSSGLFVTISGSGARIKNLILKSATIYGGSGHHSYVGALAGALSGGTIEKVAVIGGTVDGEGGNNDRVGGLIGQNVSNGTVRNSYATATVRGSAGEWDYVGGLVGRNDASTISASYASGNADGGSGVYDIVGGLVGENSTSAVVVASYATGDADGGENHDDRVGGLVGQNLESTIVASYATGDADANGGAGTRDYVGGLVGNNSIGTVVASYATGNANGSNGDYLGGLVGRNWGATIVASYATGNAQSGYHHDISALTGVGDSVSSKDSYGFGSGGRRNSSSPPPGASQASQLTAPVANNPPNTAVPQTWDSAAEQSKGAWDFGTNTQRPALKYADYDGDGDVYNCDLFPAPCGTLIPGQR